MENDIEVSKLTKAFIIGQNILEDLSFEVLKGEHVGLLGKNGAGKTTVLKMITGELEPDYGYAAVATGRRTGLMSQIPVYPAGFTGDDVLHTAHKRLDKMAEELHKLEHEMESSSDNALFDRYEKLHTEFEINGGYEAERNINIVANGLGIDDGMRARDFNELSGGERTRINLARLILEDTDILLLDEPTNHLDMAGVEWLEEYINSFKGTVLVVSHDRYFLDMTVSRIIEIKNGHAEFYSGNYSFYEVEREKRYEEQLRIWEKNESEIKRLEQSRDRLYQWGTGNKRLMHKSFAIQSRIDRIEDNRGSKPTKDREMKIKFKEEEFRADELLVLRGLSGGYDGKKLFDDVNMLVTGGERIAILGDNGTGKTTFINTILGINKPMGGYALPGPAAKVAYLPQLVSFEDPNRTLYDEMIYEADMAPQEARDRLGAFGFSGNDAFKLVSDLSGGEQRRLKLCELMKDEINLLILDEPTNHLDIASREWIESALDNYSKGLLFVSHDRYFIRKYANRIWELRGGKLNEYRCEYEEFRESAHLRAEREKQARKRQIEEEHEQKRIIEQQRKEAERAANASKPNLRNIDRKIAKAEKEIAELEKKLDELNEMQLEYANDYQKLLEISSEISSVSEQLETVMEEWEELSEAKESQLN